jgi:2-dehydro-3-deoxygalactonokinase
MIGVEWGNTTFRAFRIAPDGGIRDRRVTLRGVQRVQDGRFGDALREEVGPWLAGGERHILLSGAIGGRQGWVETGYAACPAGAGELAAALAPVGFDWAEVRIVPGLACTDPDGVPDLMRGPETTILGALADAASGFACVPGTHNAWARVEAGRIVALSTHMTGETIAALRNSASFGRNLRDGGASDPAGFESGLARSGQPGGLLHHLAGLRVMVLTGQMSDTAAASYLAGLLIGHETRAALAGTPAGATVHVIGTREASAPHVSAIAAAGGRAEQMDGEATARGLARIGAAARWD